jgi:hypothetical protein
MRTTIMTFHTSLSACEKAYLEFTAGIEPYRSILATLAAQEPGFTHEQFDDTERVLFACHSILDPIIDPLPPGLIVTLLRELHSGYGPWLAALQNAIVRTPFETDATQQAFLAAFGMAQSLIYHLHSGQRERLSDDIQQSGTSI